MCTHLATTASLVTDSSLATRSATFLLPCGSLRSPLAALSNSLQAASSSDLVEPSKPSATLKPVSTMRWMVFWCWLDDEDLLDSELVAYSKRNGSPQKVAKSLYLRIVYDPKPV